MESFYPTQKEATPFFPTGKKPEGSNSLDDDDLQAFVFSPEERWKEYINEGS